jgi:hypothetical protein
MMALESFFERMRVVVALSVAVAVVALVMRVDWHH